MKTKEKINIPLCRAYDLLEMKKRNRIYENIKI